MAERHTDRTGHENSYEKESPADDPQKPDIQQPGEPGDFGNDAGKTTEPHTGQ
jgi:hypothetical protein